MQIGVNGQGAAGLKIVDHAVGARSVAFRVPPERGERGGNSGGDSVRASEARKLASVMVRLYHPASHLATDALPTNCDLDHFQEKASLLQINHRSDELSRGSARGLWEGLEVPGQSFPSWRPNHGNARTKNPGKSSLRQRTIWLYTEIRPNRS